VAWYGDRAAIWLPKDKRQLTALSEIGKEHGQPITGMLLSKKTLDQPASALADNRMPFFEWREYILLGPFLKLGNPFAPTSDEARLRDASRLGIYKTLTEEMTLKYAASPDNGVYLFLTGQPVVSGDSEKKDKDKPPVR
jgi:hypothetical protein